MSLIIINKKSLGSTALISLSHKNGNKTTKTIGDLTIISVNEVVTSLNLANYEKYFEAKNGVHTINKNQIETISKLGYTIKDSKSKFEIGEIISKKNHPKSDKLFLLEVITNRKLNIVTNDNKVEIGNKVVVANIGAVLPNGEAILHSKVMGIESEGMLCGGETLGLEKTDGVLKTEGKNGDEFIL
ncbi:MAG: hypothetical protein HRT99_02865 [Mycoplasmatales bacterium]|nr:hypothetical protein [Mycoplasmatales bacterium]